MNGNAGLIALENVASWIEHVQFIVSISADRLEFFYSSIFYQCVSSNQTSDKSRSLEKKIQERNEGHPLESILFSPIYLPFSEISKEIVIQHVDLKSKSLDSETGIY